MRVRNTTDLSKRSIYEAFYIARRTVFEDYKPQIEHIWVRNHGRKGLSGCIYYGQGPRIVVSLPTKDYFPSIEQLGKTFPSYYLYNKFEALTAVLAHELTHLSMYMCWQHNNHSEAQCEYYAAQAVKYLNGIDLNRNVIPLNERPEIQAIKAAI